MKTVLKFLNDCKIFYLATLDGDQPRVRPYGSVCEYNEKLYFGTNNQKPTYEQIRQNSNVEISGCLNGEWIRLSGKAFIDTTPETTAAFLKANPTVCNMYSVGDGLIELFYLEDATAHIQSMSGRNDIFHF